MPPLNNKIHTYIQRVMLSFDDFSIKRKYKEKTVRTIKISLEVIRILILFLPVLTAAVQKNLFHFEN